MVASLCRVLLLALICSYGPLPCWAAPSIIGPEVGQLMAPPPDLLRRLDAAVTRQAAIDALMANPRAKALLQQEARRLGYGDAEVQGVSAAPLRVRARVKPVSNPDEDAYQAVNWHNGITFRSNAIPFYGPHNYRLGMLSMYPRLFLSYSPNCDYLWVPGKDVWPHAAVLYVELPSEPALYTLTLKLARSNGPCYPGWLTPKPGTTNAPVSVYFTEHRSQGSPTETRINLTALPDGLGYVGIISASPNMGILPAGYNMRKATARVRLELNPGSASNNEPMNYLIFHSYTLTRI